MFRIKNNIVYLSRGEDAVYARSIIKNDRYNTPYIIKQDIVEPRIRMTIKSSKNSKDPILTYEGVIGKKIPRMVTQKVINYEPTTIYPHPHENVQPFTLYRIITHDDYNRASFKYEYTDKTNPDSEDPDSEDWYEYAFTIRIVIDHEDTNNLVATTYYYDLALITRDELGDINSSEQWLEPTEFIIGGSFGE